MCTPSASTELPNPALLPSVSSAVGSMVRAFRAIRGPLGRVMAAREVGAGRRSLRGVPDGADGRDILWPGRVPGMRGRVQLGAQDTFVALFRGR